MGQARKRQTVATKQNGGYLGAGDERAKCETVDGGHQETRDSCTKEGWGDFWGRRKKENIRQLYESGMVVASPPDGNARRLHQNGMVVTSGEEKRRKM